MSDLMTSAQFNRLMNNQTTKIYNDTFKDHDSKIRDKLFTVSNSEKVFEEYLQIGNIGNIGRHNGSIDYKSFIPGYNFKIEPAEFSGGVSAERKLVKDDKFGVIGGRVKKLAQAVGRSIDILAHNILTRAFSNTYEYGFSEEGKPLCSSTHTTKTGVSTAVGFSNYGTSQISKTAIDAARIVMMRFRDDRGNLVDVNPDMIICPITQARTSYESVGYDPRNGSKSSLDPESANNKINIAMGFDVLPLKRLDEVSTTAWYIVDGKKMKECLHWINKESPDYESMSDFDTKTYKSSVYYRLGYGWLDWRFIYGNNPS